MKRLLWIAAWAGWVWLGVGLHRELPRHEGAVLRRLPMAPKEHARGFFAAGSRLASIVQVGDWTPATVRVWDVERGEVLRECALADIGMVYQFSSLHGVLVGKLPSASKAEHRNGALNLETGRWTPLPGKEYREVQFHPERPWVLVSELDDAGRGYNVTVLDLSTGDQVFSWPADAKEPERKVTNPMLFLPGRDELLVQTQGLGRDVQKVLPIVQIWKIGGGSVKPERAFEGLELGYRACASLDGHVAWTDYFSEPNSARILDLNDGTVAMYPPDAKTPQYFMCSLGRRMPHVTMSPDGRGVYLDNAIWDVSRRVPIWKCTAIEKPSKQADEGFPFIEEDWSKLLGDWAGRWKTTAVRDIATGRVEYRIWRDGDVRIPPEDRIDYAHGMYIDDDAIRPYPHPVNWPLLALCQTILALPLVLLWVVLRWRRKRRMRMAGVAP